MPEPVYLPPRSAHRTRNRGILIAVAIVIIVLLFSARSLLSYYVDSLWFGSLGYAGVFWKSLSIEWSIFGIFAVVSFAVLYGWVLILLRTTGPEIRNASTIVLGPRVIHLPLDRVMRIGGLLLALFIAILSGASMSSEWPRFALYWYHHPVAGSAVDPIFGRSIGFYLFTLPAWDYVSGWLLTMGILLCVAAALFVLVSGGSRLTHRDIDSAAPLHWGAISVPVAFLLLVLAFREYIGRFELLLQDHTLFSGITYTDAHVMLGGMLAITVALVIGAAIAAINFVTLPRLRWIVIAPMPAIVCFIVMQLVGSYVSSFIVKPNQLVREQPFIEHNIQFTRQAYALDRMAQVKFPAETEVAAADPEHNQATLQNIRLWDWRALQDTLRQIQEIRTYYDFPDVDIDRYAINGQERQVMIAARELNLDKLPVSSRTWINDKLIYTHGYGLTMNPVNGFTSEGLPTLYLSNMPIQSTVPGLNVSRPEIYFGQLTNTDVYVKTGQKEFNYPQGETNSLTSYEGSGGIPMGGLLRRILISFDRGDLGKVPFSDDITSGSHLLMRRNVSERVRALAPFLTFDSDPYIVIGDNGRLYWIIDAFTTSESYPEATHYPLGDGQINYMRNSVKAVIDAYNGTTTFYVFEPKDPVINAYRAIFPSLFKDESQMPQDLRRHVRYPEQLLSLQARVYGLYHMTDPVVFYNREDLWTIASQVGLGDSGEQVTQAMEPNYVLMKLPGQSEMEYVAILPFTPASRNNLIGWIAGRSDGANYGNAIVYNFPKTRLVDGPMQIEARIDQNAQLSGQLTLWNQQGSHVHRGSLLVIPCGKALLYAEPIYLRAERSPMPELRLVVLALQDKLAYGPTFESALQSLFAGEPSSLSAVEGAPSAQPAAPTAATTAFDLQGLIQGAARDLNDYQQLTAQGKLAEAGQKLQQLKQKLDALNAHRK
ncbi:MAG: UPF0182 family protein [Acidobacteriota bacterium]